MMKTQWIPSPLSLLESLLGYSLLYGFLLSPHDSQEGCLCNWSYKIFKKCQKDLGIGWFFGWPVANDGPKGKAK